MSEKRFIVGETLRDYYQIKCEKEDYSRVLASNTVVDLLNEQQAIIEQLKSVLRNECNIITDEDLLEYVKTNGVSLNE